MPPQQRGTEEDGLMMEMSDLVKGLMDTGQHLLSQPWIIAWSKFQGGLLTNLL